MDITTIQIKTEDPLADEPLEEVVKEQIYQCSICKVTFDDNEEAVEHLLFHSDAKLTKHHCLKCGRQCENAEEFQSHRQIHSRDQPFRCTICRKRFSHSNTLNTHMLKHQNEPSLPCPMCEKRFRYRYEVNQHLQLHGDSDRVYECIMCKKQFTGLVSLQRHNRTHLEEKRFHCAICGKKFLRPTHYTVHLRVHIGGKKIKCQLCDQMLGNKQGLRRHIKNIHEPKQPRTGAPTKTNYSCDYCPEMFTLRKLLNAHREKHELPCPICGKIFRGPARLKRHTDDHGRVLTCTICAMTFSRKHGLEQHMVVVHTNDPPKPCTQCGEILYKHNTKIHMAKHSGSKLYRCEIVSCGKEFLHASSYFRHKVSHTGERRYECDVCGKKSLQQGHHIRHMMLHGEPTHLCEICNKKFHFTQGLKKHMRRMHSSEQPFLCERCGEAFASEQRRTKHMKAAHDSTTTAVEATQEENEVQEATSKLQISVFPPEETKPLFESQKETDDGNMIGNDFDDAGDHHFDDDFGSVDDMETSENAVGSVSNENGMYFDNKFRDNNVVELTVECDQSYMSEENGEDNEEDEVESPKLMEQYFCTVCCKKFESHNDYTNHLESHEERTEFICDHCNTKFNDQTAFDLHMWYHENDKPTPCEYCGKLLYKDTFDRHMITHSGKNPFHCKLCAHKCLNAVMYERHMKNKHGENRTMQCPLCPQSFAKKTHYTRHMKVHTAEKMFVCEVCKRTFYDFTALKSHMRRIHSLEKPFGCGKCEQRFDIESELNEHTKKCLGPRLVKSEDQNGFGCAHCNVRLSDLGELVEHLQSHAEGNQTKEQQEEKELYCETCGKKFTKTALYERHIRVHSKDKPFECSVCGNKFLDKKTLRKHVARHDKSKLFPCTKCARRFTHRYDLRIHLMIHDGESPFKCEECQKTFKHSNSLTRHMRAHAGIKNYKCKICQKDFLQSGHLNEHMKTHSDGPGHHCSICDRSFKLLLSFKRHMRNVHSSVKPFLCERCGERFSDERVRDEHAATHDTEDASEKEDD